MNEFPRVGLFPASEFAAVNADQLVNAIDPPARASHEVKPREVVRANVSSARTIGVDLTIELTGLGVLTAGDFVLLLVLGQPIRKSAWQQIQGADRA